MTERKIASNVVAWADKNGKLIAATAGGKKK
jgi:hypothetical protein